jgi:two-component system, OmpR family, sensor kinase
VTFRARLVLAAAYLLAAVVIALAVPLALNVDRRATSEVESDVVADTAILSGRIADLVRLEATDQLGAVIDQATVGNGARTVVVDEHGLALADSAGTAATGETFATDERPEFQAALFEGRVDVRQRHSDTLGEDLLLVTTPVTDRGEVIGALRVSAPLGEVESNVRSSWLALGLIGLAVVGAGLVLAWILAGSLARPVEKLRAAAGRLGRGDLDARVEPEGPQEIDELGRSFNRMAGELSANLAAQRDFVANASHQLRTPLTGIKLRLEAIRAEGGTAAEQAARAEVELDRLSALVDDLLGLARAAADRTPGESVELGEAVRAAGKRWADPAAEAGHELAITDGVGGEIWAASADVAHILDNLLENAIRYSPRGTRIEVQLDRNGGRPGFVIADTGPGISQEEQAHVFERFYRGTEGRSAGPGTGLGLAIVAELAERWDGQVELLEGPGTRVRASFPAAPVDSSPLANHS